MIKTILALATTLVLAASGAASAQALHTGGSDQGNVNKSGAVGGTGTGNAERTGSTGGAPGTSGGPRVGTPGAPAGSNLGNGTTGSGAATSGR